MPLSDLLIRHAVYKGTPSGDKYPDLYGMYLLVTHTGKYWWLNYRHAGKQKTLALGVYPRVSPAQARRKAEDARKALAEGIDPNAVKRAQKAELRSAALNTFDKLARQWLLTIQRNGSASTRKPDGDARLEKDKQRHRWPEQVRQYACLSPPRHDGRQGVRPTASAAVLFHDGARAV